MIKNGETVGKEGGRVVGGYAGCIIGNWEVVGKDVGRVVGGYAGCCSSSGGGTPSLFAFNRAPRSSLFVPPPASPFT